MKVKCPNCSHVATCYEEFSEDGEDVMKIDMPGNEREVGDVEPLECPECYHEFKMIKKAFRRWELVKS